MLDFPTSEDGVRGGLQFRSSRGATLSSHAAATRHDLDDIDSPNLAQIDALRGVQSEIAAETARLAVEVQVLSKSVRVSVVGKGGGDRGTRALNLQCA